MFAFRAGSNDRILSFSVKFWQRSDGRMGTVISICSLHMRAREIAIVSVVLSAVGGLPGGCKDDSPRPGAGGSGSARPPVPAVDAAVTPPGGSACTRETLIRVSRVLTGAAHPCRGRIEAAAGRLVRIGAAASGTIVSTAPVRGAGLLATCQRCAVAGDAVLLDPEREPPVAFLIGAPARFASGAAGDNVRRYAAHRLFGPVVKTAAAAGATAGDGAIVAPADDFTLSAISGEPADEGAPIPKAVSDHDLALEDPRGLAASKAPFLDVRPGVPVLVLGFAASEGGELVASVGPVLDDDTARSRLARADAAEAAIPYDPAVELVIAARAAPGMLGGGVFDEAGRFVGVAVRASTKAVDGAYLVRAVRATYVASKLSAALSAAPVPLRAKVLPFLP